MKKIYLILAIMLIYSMPSFAVDDSALSEKISSIGFGKFFAGEPKEQITKLFNNNLKYVNKHNVEKIKMYYDKNYVNADGFDSKTYFNLIGQTWEMYPDLKYTSAIKEIKVYGDYAIVQTEETAFGNAKDSSNEVNDKGTIETQAEMVYHLKRTGNKWLITSDTTLTEKTFLKYGTAKEISFDISAPKVAVAGSEYTISLDTNTPKNTILLASITNEKVKYPVEKPQDVFRKIKEDGMLERVVIANNDGYNEHAVISIGVTEPELKENDKLQVSVSGVAFVMSRVNVIQTKNAPIQKKDKENEK